MGRLGAPGGARQVNSRSSNFGHPSNPLLRRSLQAAACGTGQAGAIGLAILRARRKLRCMQGLPSRVKAVLGPTNTGKTHLAIERMLAHSSGIIGFPLR